MKIADMEWGRWTPCGTRNISPNDRTGAGKQDLEEKCYLLGCHGIRMAIVLPQRLTCAFPHRVTKADLAVVCHRMECTVFDRRV